MTHPEISTLTPLAAERVNAAIAAPTRRPLRALLAALRFSLVPAVPAGVVALASEDPRGRAIALGAEAVVFCVGLALQWRATAPATPAAR